MPAQRIPKGTKRFYHLISKSGKQVELSISYVTTTEAFDQRKAVSRIQLSVCAKYMEKGGGIAEVSDQYRR